MELQKRANTFARFAKNLYKKLYFILKEKYLKLRAIF